MRLFLLIFLLPFSDGHIAFKQLSWEDYKGIPNSSSLASTCTGILIEGNYRESATAIFIPKESWTRTKDRTILKHEQLHFNITQWWAKCIDGHLKAGDKDKLDYYLEQWGLMEQRYDLETDHGRDSTAQKRWEQEIKL